jgi:hypothetical protein
MRCSRRTGDRNSQSINLKSHLKHSLRLSLDVIAFSNRVMA